MFCCALNNAGNDLGNTVLGQKFFGDSDSHSNLERKEVDAEKRALRALLDSFRSEPETLFEQTINSPATRRNIGKFIGYTFVKPYFGER